ncbi:hypothetical protein ACU4GR_14850 [Methylobacterium oryzae CBMB20]
MLILLGLLPASGSSTGRTTRSRSSSNSRPASGWDTPTRGSRRRPRASRSGASPARRSRRPWRSIVGGQIVADALGVSPELSGFARPLVWGTAAVLIVGAMLLLERAGIALKTRWLLSQGNASYSFYLVHNLLLHERRQDRRGRRRARDRARRPDLRARLPGRGRRR